MRWPRPNAFARAPPPPPFAPPRADANNSSISETRRENASCGAYAAARVDADAGDSASECRRRGRARARRVRSRACRAAASASASGSLVASSAERIVRPTSTPKNAPRRRRLRATAAPRANDRDARGTRANAAMTIARALRTRAARVPTRRARPRDAPPDPPRSPRRRVEERRVRAGSPRNRRRSRRTRRASRPDRTESFEYDCARARNTLSPDQRRDSLAGRSRVSAIVSPSSATLATHPEREREPGGTAREVARESGDIVIPDAELHQRRALGEDVDLDQRVVRRVERLQRERAGEPGGKAAKRVLRRAKRAKFGLLRACGDENARCETSAQRRFVSRRVASIFARRDGKKRVRTRLFRRGFARRTSERVWKFAQPVGADVEVHEPRGCPEPSREGRQAAPPRPHPSKRRLKQAEVRGRARATGWRSPRARRARRSARDRRGAIRRRFDDASSRRSERAPATEGRVRSALPETSKRRRNINRPALSGRTRGGYSSPDECGSGWGMGGQSSVRTRRDSGKNTGTGAFGKIRRRSEERPENFSRDARRDRTETDARPAGCHRAHLQRLEAR